MEGYKGSYYLDGEFLYREHQILSHKFRIASKHFSVKWISFKK